jgi:hypothetical protein
MEECAIHGGHRVLLVDHPFPHESVRCKHVQPDILKTGIEANILRKCRHIQQTGDITDPLFTGERIVNKPGLSSVLAYRLQELGGGATVQ